ncbi:hypothetical protein [Sphingomonas xinjiangensis]|uniref:Uncharacterized protein n=1 Tax=Sphingomonas xinjiangensis TaxID=643568 RepID=A0A840YRJ3_9SPHN|nr:hypothetical protein [Sphingomonas xinjiangensis]MBB5712361.1 hypothetical protein [Sphingomonas xinjiangensis]
MTKDGRAISMQVSKTYFRLITESVRLFSNKMCRFASFSEVIDDRAPSFKEIPDHYEASDLKEHLQIIPTDGEVPISITILETSAASLDGALPTLEKVIGDSVSLASAISLLLFDFIVEENKTEVLTKLGLTSEEAKAYRGAMTRKSSNVIPLR